MTMLNPLIRPSAGAPTVVGVSGLWRSALAALALLATLLAFAPAQAALTFPPLTGRVVDNAHVLTDQTTADLTAKLAALEQKTGDQLIVVTLADLQGADIQDYGYQLGRAWGIGQKGKNNGVLFIVVPSEHKVRIEVGYGLEPVLTDGLSSVILQTQVLPKFRAGDYNGGVESGTDALVQQLGLDPKTAAANVQAAEADAHAEERHAGGLPPRAALFLIGLAVFFFIRMMMGGGRGGGGLLWAAPFLFMGGGGYRGGDGGGGGGFGGGFGGGGGGSFGGGGSSGSW